MKIRLIIVLVIIMTSYVSAQVPAEPTVYSPNTSTLGTFGNIPVGYYTGIPNISIPIYTVTSGNIKLPINLSYHPANVRPNEHPGWVGLGWNLSCGGVIRRVMHGYMDELDYGGGIINSYYNTGHSELCTVDWDSEESLKKYFQFNIKNGAQVYDDCEADEFYFNFLGYSGKFFYTSAGWQSISDNNLKIENQGFIKGDVPSDLNKGLVSLNVGVPVSRYFEQFIITTDDGTKYYFGGSEAIEYVGDYYYKTGNGYDVRADAWYLTKIVDINGNMIQFKYQRTYPVCKISYYLNFFEYSCSIDDEWKWARGNTFGLQTTSIDTAWRTGSAIFPVYLKEVVGDKEKIQFEISNSVERRYSDYYFKYSYGISGIDELNWILTSPNRIDKLQWSKLDIIKIVDADGETGRIIDFTYSSNPDQRLTLNSVSERGELSNDVKKYNFNYNDVHLLPRYGGDFTDHWGFYNGRTIKGSSNFYNTKEPDPELVKKGLLKQIIYPTGGYTDFEWEINKFSRYVGVPRHTLVNQEGNSAGVRIKKIKDSESIGSDPIVREFFYVNDFPSGGSVSSGIQNGRPQYTFIIANRPATHGDNDLVSYKLQLAYDLTSYSSNSDGSPIGYSEVVEKFEDGSYNRYIFSNYGLDINNKTHYDIAGNTIGWEENYDAYIAFSSLEKERGKLLRHEVYNAQNVPVERTDYVYTNSEIPQANKYLRRVEMRNSFDCGSDNFTRLVYATAIKEFNYRYNLEKKVHTLFGLDGMNPKTETTFYSFNRFDQIISEKYSNGDDLITQYTTYPSDYYQYDFTFINKLQSHFQLSLPIEKVRIRGSDEDPYILDGQLFIYKNDNYSRLDKVFKLELPNGNPIELNQFKFSNKGITGATPEIIDNVYYPFSSDTRYSEELSIPNYDLKGNPTLFSFKNKEPISFIWSSKGSFLLAKVTNSEENSFAFSSFENSNDKGNWEYSGLPEMSGYAKTGNGYYNLSNGPISKNLAIGKYKLQFWSKGEVFTTGTNIQSVFVSNPDENGWILNEKEINIESASGVITISGSNSSIDELRIFPLNSRMVSYSYDPVDGLLSESDENCRVKTYVYDDMGRLSYVKDNEGNIIKMMKYNYKNN